MSPLANRESVARTRCGTRFAVDAGLGTRRRSRVSQEKSACGAQPAAGADSPCATGIVRGVSPGSGTRCSRVRAGRTYAASSLRLLVQPQRSVDERVRRDRRRRFLL